MQQRVIEKPYHKWTPVDKSVLRVCKDRESARQAGGNIGVSPAASEAMWDHLVTEKTTEMAHFDYSKLVPLKALFTKCPVCNGTTGVNENAYCHSCLSQWNPITLEPMQGLHKADPVD